MKILQCKRKNEKPVIRGKVQQQNGRLDRDQEADTDAGRDCRAPRNCDQPNTPFLVDHASPDCKMDATVAPYINHNPVRK